MVTTSETTRNGRSRPSSPMSRPVENSNSNKLPPSETPETSDDDSSHSKKNLPKAKNGGAKSEFEEKIRVGKDYQVVITPETNPRPDNYPDKALLVWSPARHIPESKLDEYTTLAKEKYGYNAEQALGMLFWHKHDMDKAVVDLANFTPFPDEWTKEDKVLFEQAFQFHGKCFHRIRQMLPDKSISSLVKFYYSWKKTRSRTSVMDRQEKKKNEGGSENGSENGSPDDSDIEDKDVKRFGAANGKSTTGHENKDTGYSSSSSSSNGASKLSSLNCQNCTVLCDQLKVTTVGSFCLSCFHHWRRTGVMRPTQGPHNMGIGVNQRPRSKTNKLYYYQGYHDGSSKYKRKPPKGMYINHDDVLKLAAQDLNANETPRKQPVSRNNDLLVETEREIGVLYSQIQTNKQKISSLKAKNEQIRDGRLPEEVALNRVNQRWTKDEYSLAIRGFRKFGQNFKAIAEVIGTKTESHVRKYFFKNRKAKELESVCRERESQKPTTTTASEVKQVVSNIEIMEIDSDDETTQVKDTEVEDASKLTGKTSIMTTSTGKTLKRKHEDDAVKSEAGDVCIITDESLNKKKFMGVETNTEITITPIPKASEEKDSIV